MYIIREKLEGLNAKGLYLFIYLIVLRALLLSIHRYYASINMLAMNVNNYLHVRIVSCVHLK